MVQSVLPHQTLDPALAARVDSALTAIRAGRPVILVDDEDRENEGDLVYAAQFATPEAINFMAKYGRGLICLTLTPEQIDRLQLQMMPQGGAPLATAFTLSIEARHGVTTGISAADRSHTVRVAIRPDAGPQDIVTPGHIFPLRARPGGVLVRSGQTEGSVDLAELAGLQPAAVICEIMNDDGTMARLPDLRIFAQTHDLRILSIADLIRYRLHTERLVQRDADASVFLDDTQSQWRCVTYSAKVGSGPFFAFVKGEPASQESALCRVHSGELLSDVFGAPAGAETGSPSGRSNLRRSLQAIEREGHGVLLYLPPSTLEADRQRKWAGGKVGGDAPAAEPRGALREFGLGAQILADLGLGRIRLLTNHPRRLAGIEGYGLVIDGSVSLTAEGQSRPDPQQP